MRGAVQQVSELGCRTGWSRAPRCSWLTPGRRRTSASQRCSGCPADRLWLRTVTTSATRRSRGPAARYIKTSRVLWSAHWRSSTSSATGREAVTSSSQASRTRGAWSAVSQGSKRGMAGSLGGPQSRPQGQQRHRDGRRGRQAPLSSRSRGSACRQASATRAVCRPWPPRRSARTPPRPPSPGPTPRGPGPTPGRDRRGADRPPRRRKARVIFSPDLRGQPQKSEGF